jgi:hypothetical protein
MEATLWKILKKSSWVLLRFFFLLHVHLFLSLLTDLHRLYGDKLKFTNLHFVKNEKFSLISLPKSWIHLEYVFSLEALNKTKIHIFLQGNISLHTESFKSEKSGHVQLRPTRL